jgi:hypothetical protein
MPRPNRFLKAVVLTGLTFLGCAVWLEAKPDVETPPFPAIRPLKVGPADDAMQKLLKARYNDILAETELWYKLYGVGKASTQPVVTSARRLLRTGLELHREPEGKMSLLKPLLELSKTLDALAPLMPARDPEFKQLELHYARQFKLDVEIEMLKLKKDGAK